MVRDGYYYGFGMLLAAVLVAWLASPAWAVLPVVLAGFFLWFFRDPERVIPVVAGAIVSPADGRVTDISAVEIDGSPRTRVSIFLSVFDVHVNRSPVAGIITGVQYRKGLFKNAMGAECAECKNPWNSSRREIRLSAGSVSVSRPKADRSGDSNSSLYVYV